MQSHLLVASYADKRIEHLLVHVTVTAPAIEVRPKLATTVVSREQLLQAVLAYNPKLTREEALEMLQDAGL